ncbi:GDP-mannose 4,6-dehydratase [Candidatus Aminicenantes bacterium AC-335-A11]|nr:GDP-mannose 4,6-dehydratase [SCandidatus Aminicenantes bacterium Aminicenantia_JdfR_composite]MCP2597388.1 GDP-mannose 4,6-dehydratase [Candidatus Aminicenantes bacterium AC-335-G13]MCP2605804.1 GDP-mannose 4,6-dehydratase [Candidatus Aminicenantes bacterium AC-335-O07]MCP2618650.1 GDP-mannose 4,6-dehydratase [Candidatus Aminicenantes bacterium AC-335-A11]MCP2620834.1 GDP-mannose 4,6-dehydratase [Candidatus Aminicenantes bacterium AC-334-E05]
MKAFITGLTGFVGKYLSSFLRKNNVEVYGTSYPEKPPSHEKNIFYVDIKKSRSLSELIKEIQPEYIFHLAAISNVHISWKKRKLTMDTNVIGTLNLLEAIRKYSPKSRLLLIGSSDIYGCSIKEKKVFKENDNPAPINPYGISKLFQEILGKFYSSIENLWIIMTRSFNHTGPGQTPIFVCSDWAKQIAEIEKGIKEPVLKVGNLDSIRDFTDVRDIVRAYYLLILKGRKGEVYNVCSGKAYSLREILDMLVSHSKISIRVEIDKRKVRKTDFPFLVGDNSKLVSHTGWRPEINLEKTLLDLLNYWRKRV